MDVREVLSDVAGLGPFFAVATDPAEAVDPSWRPMSDLYGDPGPLRERIAHVRRVLGGGGPDAAQVEERVAASIALQGLAALVVSAPFAAVVLHGVAPRLTAATLHWRTSVSGPWRLWCAAPGADRAAGVDDGASALAAALFDEHLSPLVAAVRARVGVAERLLWGNVASSVAGARRQVATQRPAAARRAAEVAERLLTTGPLAGAGELRTPQDPDRHWTFRRRSCCLYYKVPGGGLCGDCVLHARPPR